VYGRSKTIRLELFYLDSIRRAQLIFCGIQLLDLRVSINIVRVQLDVFRAQLIVCPGTDFSSRCS
jgi:hypothetical protein